ncbi:MAG: hypothetical protein IT338_03590 [Thermomicrobiales bacterium]|nr:hypothetical protein [Thermomicrobiales bacterium]
MSNDILLTGPPRSGTTLSCHLLNKLPDTVALHEPMKVRELAELRDHAEICRAIARFCGEQRTSILEEGKAKSKQVNGVVPENYFGDEPVRGGLRSGIVSHGEIVVDRELSPDFALVIKHIAGFTAIIEEAVNHFPVYALVRNPLAILASWNSIDRDFRRGHARGAERLDAQLTARLTAIKNTPDRQLALLGWFFEQAHRHLPQQSIIHYEAVVEQGGAALAVMRPSAAALHEPLENFNTNPLYNREAILRLGDRLLQSDGAYWQSYSRESVEFLLAEFTAGVAS